MILLDSDILVIDLRYPRDPRTAINQQVLQRIRASQVSAGIMLHTLLEVVGAVSFNTSPGDIPKLPRLFLTRYNLQVVPDPQSHPDYGWCLKAIARGRGKRVKSRQNAVGAESSALRRKPSAD